ncbi:acyl-CoA--sterol O-acyltransferase 1-like [Eucalyptus grandis]|uniref:acyl-CoA--sterol O-acyltransferase 1-like n=1 Tax=Eucalyptus grandis TaxID=71139 RepID=UPI00192ECBDF|nr:acyl-CoA--sterol O-acyltransferase 1-like [Eucalyptus grandis]
MVALVPHKNSYCYISVLVPVGLKRLLFFLPMILLFLLLPLHLTLTLAGLTSFFVAWLSIFKLLLLAYRKGPLVPPPTSSPLSFPLFVTIVSLSIKISPSVESAATENGGGGGALKSLANYVAKCLLLVLLFPLYQWRLLVYEAIRLASSRLVGRQWAPLPPVLATFTVSILMHELIFYYIGRKEPTWVVMWFFLLHGVAVATEVIGKKAL